jgi:hypothetical protein
MQGELGICLQGSHPDLIEATVFNMNMVRTIHETRIKCISNITNVSMSNPAFSFPSRCCSVPDAAHSENSSSMLAKAKADSISDFIHGEELITETTPNCGGCKCGKCPSESHSCSFREEQELHMTKENLTHNPESKCLFTSYPDNYAVALETLQSTEHISLKAEKRSELYSDQIADVLECQVTQKLSPEHNVADCQTLDCSPEQLGPQSESWSESCNLKIGVQRGDLPTTGEKKLVITAAVNSQIFCNVSNCIDYKRFNSVHRLYWVMARILNIFRMKTFKGGRSDLITPDLLDEAESLVIKDVQRSLTGETNKKRGRYSSLQPECDEDGFWVIGSRLKRGNPMTVDGSSQKLLPYHHPVTCLIMKAAHEDCGHRGRDATLARFRQNFWVPHGGKLAATVKHNCQLCKLMEPILLSQKMGLLPEDRMTPSPPFSKVMVDLFGPYKVRGEIQKRTSGKAYGILFTDLVMRAVHVEAAFGYDTNSFLMALTRFASVRGWPDTLYSDPGSQLVGAERELRNIWQQLDQTALTRKGTENGMQWKFGAPDSPWHQVIGQASEKEYTFFCAQPEIVAS